MFCCFSLYRAIQKGDQAVGQNRARIYAYRVVQTLYRSFARRYTHLYAHDFASLLGFLCMALYRGKQQKKKKKNAGTFDLLRRTI